MHVESTEIRRRKVTHLVTIEGADHHCTSATHVCETLAAHGHIVTPAVVYRALSKNPKRALKRPSMLPDTITVARYAD